MSATIVRDRMPLVTPESMVLSAAGMLSVGGVTSSVFKVCYCAYGLCICVHVCG